MVQLRWLLDKERAGVKASYTLQYREVKADQTEPREAESLLRGSDWLDVPYVDEET